MDETENPREVIFGMNFNTFAEGSGHYDSLSRRSSACVAQPVKIGGPLYVNEHLARKMEAHLSESWVNLTSENHVWKKSTPVLYLHKHSIDHSFNPCQQ